MNKKLTLILGLGALAVSATSLAAQTPTESVAEADLPPNAKPGECYARVLTEPQYRTETERVLIREEGEEVRVIPAKYETATQRVLVSEASTRLEVVPATYGWVEEKVLVRPESKKLVTEPAKYETVTERIMVEPAKTVWKKGTGPIQKIDESTGEIMCLVEVPAVYETVSKRVLKAPATTRETIVPAEYKTIRKRVLKTPATTREVEIPAEYEVVEVTKETQPSRTEKTKVPAEYETVEKRAKVADGRLEWRSILCDTNMTRGRITSIQRALKTAGFDPGSIDGVIGSSTIRAVNAYQRANDLPVDKYLNMETVRALGVMEYSAPDQNR